MNDKVAQIQDNIDEAKRNTDELHEDPGAIPTKQIEKLKDSLDEAEDIAEGLDDFDQE
jgi:hypothetical protein